MYQWLSDALQGPSSVITANRRLVRVLRDAFANQQLQADMLAWESPAIYAWQDWLESRMQGATDQASLPTRINAHQSQLLWERCLSKEIGDSLPGITSLVRLSRDAWQRLADWQVPIQDVARAAQSHDQRLFAAAAGRYLGILQREHWVDDAGLSGLILELLQSGRANCQGCVTFVGFDRERPVVSSIMTLLERTGCDVRLAPIPEMGDSVALQSFDTADAEMRAAGAWARQRLENDSGQTIAIIAGNLEQDAEAKTRLVREGFVPGWQYAPSSLAQSVNVSYGRKLIDYPAVSIALMILQWLVRDLSAGEIGHLLRTPMLGPSQLGSRSRLELRLRQLPDRKWSPAMFSAALRGRDNGTDASEWLTIVASISKARREIKRSASPAEWAVYIDNTLSVFNWPGRDALSSDEFQLVNRWRDLLNDLARLDLVSPVMNLKNALRRLELMAAETVFQPESDGSAVQLIGPLEASGAQFDAIWISGVTAANWPPPGNPSPLLSRRLQRDQGMPDADPADTVAYARSLLLRLGGSAREVVCSYSLSENDAEQTPSDLLRALAPREQAAQADPGWHAARLSTRARTVVVRENVPKIVPGERISGGAGTIQRQLTNPLAAFIVGRLCVRNLQPQAVGLPASLRGNIIHDALYQFYIDTPTHHDISAWTEDELLGRIAGAVDFAFARHERNTDEVLIELLKLERLRIAELLKQFVDIDRARGEFSIAAVEQELAFAEADVRMQLRVDRVDRLPDGALLILDYKTGGKRTFLNSDGSPKEIQLIAYALALDEPVSAVALVNIDSRAMSFSGAGHGYTDSHAWDETLAGWKSLVRSACRDLSAGDVRINAMQAVKDARDFNLLSRYTELLRGE
jgi:probable DNA repair protein